jgi:DNA-binding SARP family transcriptional activator
MLADVLKHLAQWQIEQGAYENALPPARRWVALDPLHEPAQRLVMQLYAWAGQPSAALRQYQVLVDLLQEELGVAPEAETSALNEAIRARRFTAAAQARPRPFNRQPWWAISLWRRRIVSPS